ncbi:hypothetical protein SCUCBS95973_003824 [Sporothrix curviconia]|uniref:Leucine rich repeat domain containing protein n=1 Tax=Sporothrix curviconia TaxID=1260050 RepID=A0ABP0BIJ1_9PEZI
MASLPSYEEAVSGGHWLDLVAPYVAIKDYPKLCRVSRRFYDQFAPRLWSDPLQTVRLLGLHPNDDLRWFTYFVTGHAKSVRESTRRLIVALDFRAFATDAPASLAGTNGHGFSETLRLIGVAFPAVRCILLGGNTGYDPSDLGRLLRPGDFPGDGSVSMPLILDIGRCGMPLPNDFFHPSYWRQLVYLDMSGVPGSLKGIIKTGTFDQGALPNLRILKLRGRELDEASLIPIAEYARLRLWSLDLSQNKLADSCVRRLFYPCFGTDDLTAPRGCHEVEGKLAVVQVVPRVEVPPMWRGWFSYIVESLPSAAFSHPDRYLADSPVYDEGGQTLSRLAGNEPLRSDRVIDAKNMLAGGPGQPAPDWHDIQDADICKLPPSLTHVHLSDNPEFTVEGVESMFRFSRGHIRHFDCASPAIATGGQVPFSLTGIVGRSHIFRPVFASNLQSLRIHHSLVTHIPTLHDPDKSVLVALKYAETVLRKRAEMAYPQAVVPDLNPRLQSLTLTCLPRVSTGPLIDKLIRFLVCAADQENALRAQQSAVPVSRRGPTMLRGLRHIRLEFEPYPPQDEDRDGAFESLDAQALLDSSTEGEQGFSFFGEERPATAANAKDSRREVRASEEGSGNSCGDAGGSGPNGGPNSSPGTAVADQRKVAQSDRLPHYPLPGAVDSDSEFVREVLALEHDSGSISQKTPNTTIKVFVWVGSGRRSSNRAVNAYMANLSRESLRTHIRPATPDQVKAGVPVEACVYNAAWDAILWLTDETLDAQEQEEGDETPPLPTSGSSEPVQGRQEPKGPSSRRQGHHSQGMRDVVNAIRQFRAGTRASHHHRARGMSPMSRTGQGQNQQQEHQQQQKRRPAPRHWTGTLEVLLAS